MMREAIFMTVQVVKAVLTQRENGNNILRFNIGGADQDLNLDDETNEEQVKSVFDALLAQMVNEDIQVVADIPEERVHDLYGEVCAAYVTQLNTELSRVQSRMNSLGLSNGKVEKTLLCRARSAPECSMSTTFDVI